MIKAAIKTVTYSQQDIIRILRDLEMMIVSLDRIGSAGAELDVAERASITAEFVDQWRVFARLAEARQVLSEPFADDVDADGTDELERELQDIHCWTSAARTP